MLPTKQPVTERKRSTSSCFMHHPFAIFLASGLSGFVFATIWNPDVSNVYHASVNIDDDNNNNKNNNNNNVNTTYKKESNNAFEVATSSSSNGYVHSFQIFVSICVLYILIVNVMRPIFTKLDQQRRYSISSTHTKQKLHQYSAENQNQLYSIFKLSLKRLIPFLSGVFLGGDIGFLLRFFLYLRKNDDISIPFYMVILKRMAGVTILMLCKQVVFAIVLSLSFIWIYPRMFADGDSYKNESNDEDSSNNSFEEDNTPISTSFSI